MKSYLLIICTFFIQTSLLAQDKLPPLDKSPLDISYCPPGYIINKASGNSTEPLVARVIYSRPAVSNRKIFGGLIEFEKVWRFGANEATEIEFFKDVLIAGKKLTKGRYTLYAIPTEKKWTIILNKETDTWGAFTYDAKKDMLRVDAPVENTTDFIESFTIYFDKLSSNHYALNTLWENAKVSVSFSVVK